MTTTLTLTQDAESASVLIQATTNAAGLTLMRADQNGTVPVRLLPGQDADDGALVIRDYEPALVGPVRYTCTTTEPVELRRNAARYPRAVAGQWTSGATSNVSAPTIETEGGEPFARFTRLNGTATALRAGGFNSTGAQLPAGRVQAVLEVRGSTAVRATLSVRQGTSTATLARGTDVVPTAEWQQFTATLDNPAAGSTFSIALVVAAGGAAGDVVDIRRAGFIVGGDAYFDGSSPGAQWTGAVNESPSVVTGIESVERVVRFDEGADAISHDVAALVLRPQWRARGLVTTTASLRRRSLSTKHEPVGRPDPIYTLRRGSFRSGSVEVFCDTYQQALAFDALIAEGGVVMLRHAASIEGRTALSDLYAVVDEITLDPVPENVVPRPWRVVMTLTEVRRPSAPLAGAAVWTFADIAGLGVPYASLPQMFATMADLASGVRTDV